MQILRDLQQALSNLWANRLRSALTMLGVIIGVSAVILLVSIVEGARAQVVGEFERLGSNLILIFYNPNLKEVQQSGRRIEGMTEEDVDAIREQSRLIAGMSAEVSLGDDVTARFRDQETKVRPRGVQPDYARLNNVSVDRGRFLTDDDMTHWDKVCVIGDKVRRELFSDTPDPVGRSIEVQGVSLLVVGVLAPKGQTLGQDNDTLILMPITTAQKRLLGSDAVHIIYAQPRPGASVPRAMDQVWEILMRRHDNAPGFRVDSQESILNAVGRIMTIFGLVVGSVAGLALLVGGIGIMNIMLVSVTERTREIGIRKAVGARRSNILIQFLIEAATVSGVGGLIGIGLGAGTAYAIGAVSSRVLQSSNGGGGGSGPFAQGVPVHVPLWIVLGAFLFSAFVGVFFGIYPAFRAAQLDPIEALRHE